MRSFDQYQNAAIASAASTTKDDENILVLTLGILGEAGEVCDYVKKIIGHGHELDKNKLMKEIGDNFWYLAVASHVLGFKLSDLLSESQQNEKTTTNLGQMSKQLGINAADIASLFEQITTTNNYTVDQLALSELFNKHVAILSQLSYYLGTTPQNICKQNIKKLQKRYPNGFSTEASKHRTE